MKLYDVAIDGKNLFVENRVPVPVPDTFHNFIPYASLPTHRVILLIYTRYPILNVYGNTLELVKDLKICKRNCELINGTNSC